MPGRARLIAVLTAGAAALIGLTGCGPPPPQAPVGVASKVSSALTTIAASCGESYREQAFNPKPPLHGLDAVAASSAHTLLGYARRHPRWIYQGMTLAQLREQAHSRLTECDLHSAAAVLSG